MSADEIIEKLILRDISVEEAERLMLDSGVRSEDVEYNLESLKDVDVMPPS